MKYKEDDSDDEGSKPEFANDKDEIKNNEQFDGQIEKEKVLEDGGEHKLAKGRQCDRDVDDFVKDGQ